MPNELVVRYIEVTDPVTREPVWICTVDVDGRGIVYVGPDDPEAILEFVEETRALETRDTFELIVNEEEGCDGR